MHIEANVAQAGGQDELNVTYTTFVQTHEYLEVKVIYDNGRGRPSVK